MPWKGKLSSLWNHKKLYKPSLRRWLDTRSACFICRGAVADEGLLCGGCLADLPIRKEPRLKRKIEDVDAAFAVYRYEFPITELIRSAKFHSDLGALSVLTEGFGDGFVAELDAIDLIVPVPLLPWRFLRRGFNQAGELARVLGRKTPCTVRHDLIGRRNTWGRAQSSLGAADRRDNMRDAFRVNADFGGLRVAIVDDIITTGATSSALAKVLKAAGADTVIAVAIAATSPHRDDAPI